MIQRTKPYIVKNSFTAYQFGDPCEAVGLIIGALQGKETFILKLEVRPKVVYYASKNALRLFVEENRDKCIREVHGNQLAIIPLHIFNQNKKTEMSEDEKLKELSIQCL